MHILHVVGARPNFMKAAPVMAALAARGVQQTLVHTGQHYDEKLSGSILSELGMPAPDVNLGVGSGSHAEQTAQVLTGVERTLVERTPDIVIVYGDVNSTLAAALAAVKLGFPVAHVEAGLRSRDRTMPEEINRILTDRLATTLYTPSEDADTNLREEGVPAKWVHRVGNVMIDTLVRLLPCTNAGPRLADLDLMSQGSVRPFALVTLHRPSNVDEPDMLRSWMSALSELGRDIAVIFPMHPRTRTRLIGQGIPSDRIAAIEPLTYLEFLGLQRHAALVITDSGGIQEESTFLGVPCLTLRETTERPITVTVGTNVLIGRNPDLMKSEARRILSGAGRKGGIPPLWDGLAAERLAAHLTG